MPGMTTALIIGGIAATAGSIGAAAIGSSAASKAAKEQSDAAKYAAGLTSKAGSESLAFQKEIWEKQQADQAPFLGAGTKAINYLSQLTQPGGELLKPWDTPFNAPTDITMQNDPGYAFRLAEGQKILERSAAAKGNLLTGGTAKALERFGQDYASNEYGNVYERAMREYGQKYDIFQNNQANKYNRLAGLAGIGQVSATELGREGGQAAQNTTGINFATAQGVGNAYQNAAAARASGYINSANMWGGALGNIANYAGQLPYMSMFNKNQGGSNLGLPSPGVAGGSGGYWANGQWYPS